MCHIKSLITQSFKDQAMSLPDKTKAFLATHPAQSAIIQEIGKGAALFEYAKRLRLAEEHTLAIIRPIAISLLRLKAGMGATIPARPPDDRGQGRSGNKSIPSDGIDLDKNTATAYRKLAANVDKLEAFCCETEDVPSQAAFLKMLTDKKREAKDKQAKSRRAKNAKKVSSVKSLDEIDQCFATILIDPPWDWDDEGDVNQLGRAKPQYATMPFAELVALPIAKVSDVDCHIYCWVTNRSMPKVFSLLDAWDFRYVTLLTWPKTSFGMGNYFRGQTEHIAFGVKGSQQLQVKDASTLLPAWKRGGKHSSKPNEIHAFIERCSPGPFLEMFSRTKHDGWFMWGEQT